MAKADLTIHSLAEDLEELRTDFVKAFPAGDFDGHRRYHELLVEQLEERRRLRIAIQEKTMSALAWSVMVALGAAIWHEIQRALGRA